MPHKTKGTVEKKVQIVEAYLSGKAGRNASCRNANITWTTLRLWVSLYKAEGPKGFLPQRQNRRYSKETKLAAVLDYLAGKGSQRDICERYQIRSGALLRLWLKAYNRHGDFKEPSEGSRMMKPRKTTQEERLEIVKSCIAGENSYSATAIKYKVSYQQVYLWTKKYREMGEAGLEDRRGRRAGTMPSRTPEEELRDRVAQLERKNSDLEMENALLKKVKELGRRRR